MCTVVGKFYESISLMSKEEVMSEMFQVLQNMYGESAVYPEEILIPDWHHNKFFRGTYSNWPIGVDRTMYNNLCSPLSNLYMAGEACYDDVGYLHGAYISGRRTAEELYNCFSKNQCNQSLSELFNGKAFEFHS